MEVSTQIVSTWFDDIIQVQQTIELSSQKIKDRTEEITSYLATFLTDWQPTFNEKAVYLMPETKDAWHVWFVAFENGKWKFKEAPNEYPSNHYYYHSKTPTDTYSRKDFVILPLD